MSIVTVARKPGSVKVYVAGLRLHHGITGIVVAGAGLALRRRRMFLLGCAITAHDWRDWPWPIIDP
jgi:hypothetical protein